MKMTTLLLVTLSMAFISSLSFAQNDAFSDLSLNRAALRYYNGIDLKAFESENAAQYDALRYYFTSSFDVSMVKNATEEVDYNSLFNQDLFNIVEFENLRLNNESATFVFKEKYTITLKPIHEVNSNLVGNTIEGITSLVPPRPLPSWVATGNDTEDYENYKRYLNVWIRDFPEEYRALTSSSTLNKITISEFLAFPLERREAFTAAQGAYIIID